MILNLSIGLITPPIGTVLYVGSGVSKVSIGNISKSILPYLLVYFIIMFSFVFFPEIIITPMNYFS